MKNKFPLILFHLALCIYAFQGQTGNASKLLSIPSDDSYVNTTFSDTFTEPPSLNNPQQDFYTGKNTYIAVDFSLPESAKPGTVQLSFRESGDLPDKSLPHIIILNNNFETAGQHKITLNGSDLSSSEGVASVNSESNDMLVSGTTYTVTISYQDQTGNPLASDSNTGFNYGITPPTIPSVIISSPVKNPINNYVPVTIHFSEQVNGFTVEDVTLRNTTLVDFQSIDNQTFKAELKLAEQGLVTVDIAANVATNKAGEGNMAANSFSLIYSISPKSILGWGGNVNGQLGDGTTTDKNIPTKMGDATDWEAVFSSGTTSFAIKGDGTLWAWGGNNNGQIGDGTTTNRSIAVQIGTDTDWASIYPGIYHTIAIKTDGTLWAWGLNTNGQLGDGTNISKPSPVKIGNDHDWTSASVTGSHTVAIKTDGTLWAWGWNYYGQLGDGTTIRKSSPVKIGSDHDWASVSVSGSHSVAIKTDGTLWAWGYNFAGQLGDGTTIRKSSPVKTGSDNNWSSVSVGINHTVAIKKDGTLWAWGENNKSQLGDGTITNRSIPVQIGTDIDWASISTGYDHTIAIKTDRTVWAWGENINGQLGDGTTESKISPTLVNSAANWITIDAGSMGTIALFRDINEYIPVLNKPLQNSHSGRNVEVDFFLPKAAKAGTVKLTLTQTGGVTDVNSPHTIIFDATLETVGQQIVILDADNLGLSKGVSSVSSAPNDALKSEAVYSAAISYQDQAGNPFISDLTSDFSYWSNGLWAWGGGGLGDGTTNGRLHPIRTYPYTDIANIATGLFHTMVIKTDGTLWAWGSNVYGQIGDGTTTEKTSPVQIGLNTDWATVYAGEYHSLAIKKDGTLWAWGRNHASQLGDGSVWNKSSPVQIGNDNDWASVSAGFLFSLGLKKDGTLWAWGWNNYGQLGDGTMTEKYIPTQIGNDSDWFSISGGQYHALAIKKDGTLWAWGWNNYGQLGDGTTINRNFPVQISRTTDWAFVSASQYHSLGVKKDGTLWAWGRIGAGYLGDGTTIENHNPIQIGTETNWGSVTAGPSHNLAIKEDGTLWAWGWNYYGQVGDGTTIERNSPVRISTIKGWQMADVGNAHSVAVLNYDFKTLSIPAKPNLAATSDTGFSNTDGITKDSTPEFTGTVEANAQVSVFINDVVVASTTADADGNWSYSISPGNALADGIYQVKISTTDPEGNESVGSKTLTVIIDSHQPIIQTKNISIGLDAIGNAVISAEDIENGSTDNISSAENLLFSLSRTAFGCADKGQTPEVILSATDEAGNAATGIATVTVEDNIAPTIEAGQTFVIDENSAAGSEAGSIVATDNCSHENFSISAGNTGDAFVIDATGLLTVNNAAALNYETSPEFSLTLTAVDGTANSPSQTVSISLNNLNDNAPVIAVGQSFRIGENTAAGTSVGTLSANDADGATTYSNWTIVSGNEAGGFAIDATTGAITVGNASVLDYETTNSFTLVVSVSDGMNISPTEQVVIILNNPNNNPPILSALSDEAGNELELISFTAMATDADNTDELQYYLAEGAPAGASIHSATGAFSWTPGEEQGPASYTISIIVSDGELSSTQEMSVTVNEVNQTPFFTSTPVITAKEEGYAYQLTATDADFPANTLTYEAVEIPSWLSFDAATQTLSGTPDKTAEVSSLIRLQVSDGQEISTQEFTLEVEVTTGLLDREKQEYMLVYPNPAKGRLIIELGNVAAEEKVTISLLSPEGRLLIQKHGSLQSGTESISAYLQEAKTGAYLLQVKDKDSIRSIKVLKE